MPLHRFAFTLIELLVVITIIVVLLALLAPALDKAIEQAERVVCAGSLHAISVGAATYGLGNKRALFICAGREQTMAFLPKGSRGGAGYNSPSDAAVDWPAALASVGLASPEKHRVPADPYDNPLNPYKDGASQPDYKDNLPGKMWDCPSRNWQSHWTYSPVYSAGSDELNQYVWLSGYMYYGGLAVWKNPYRPYTIKDPPTPRKIGDPGDRVLASDVTAKVSNQWGGTPSSAYYLGGTPPHKEPGTMYPAGQNQAYLNGAVEWVEADRLLYIHDWNNSTDEMFFLWQSDLGGWDPGPNDRSNPNWLSYHKK